MEKWGEEIQDEREETESDGERAREPERVRCKEKGEKQGKSMLQCYAFAQVQGFQTTCGGNKAQEVTVVSEMLTSREREERQGKLYQDQKEDYDMTWSSG